MREFRKNGQREEIIACIRAYLLKNPDDYGFMKVLSWELFGYADTLTDKEQIEKLVREALELGKRALDLAPSNWHPELKYIITIAHWRLGEYEAGDELFKDFTPIDLNEFYMEQMKYMRGEKRVSKAFMRILDAFQIFVEAVNCMVDFDDEYEVGFSDAEKLARLELAYGMVPIVFDDDRCQYYAETVAELCAKISELHIKTGNADKGFIYLEKAAKYAAEFDGLKVFAFENVGTEACNSYFNSTLVKFTLSTGITSRHRETVCGELLKTRLSRAAFDIVRDDLRFKDIEARLTEGAKKD